MAASNDVNEEVSAFPPDVMLMLVPKEQFLRTSFRSMFDAKFIAEGKLEYRDDGTTTFVGEVLKNKYGPSGDKVEVTVNLGF